MLYQIYESRRALLGPFFEFACAFSKLYRHPASPLAYTPMAQHMAAGFDLLNRLARDYNKPPFDISHVFIGGCKVAVQEQVAMSKPFCRLLRLKRFTDAAPVLTAMKVQPIVLLVAPLSGHHATLLRDTARSLLQDHKVYITDWVDARMVSLEDGAFHLDDYVRYIMEFIRHIGPDVHVVSVCQPTVPVLAAVSLMASQGEFVPRSLTVMGGPIDARQSPTKVNNLAAKHSYAWFEHNAIYRVPSNYPGAGRQVYPGFLQYLGFVAMNPSRHVNSHYDYFLDLVKGDMEGVEDHRAFYDEYNAVLDMSAEFYLDTIKTVFQDFALTSGTWVIDGRTVRPQDIVHTALLSIEGELDDIAGTGQTHAAHDLCSSIPLELHRRYDVRGAGHYGIFSGRRWREHVYPQIRMFIAEFNASRNEEAPAPINVPSGPR
jgi:poly(3-hydroxybutyrate) depolymerase